MKRIIYSLIFCLLCFSVFGYNETIISSGFDETVVSPDSRTGTIEDGIDGSLVTYILDNDYQASGASQTKTTYIGKKFSNANFIEEIRINVLGEIRTVNSDQLEDGSFTVQLYIYNESDNVVLFDTVYTESVTDFQYTNSFTPYANSSYLINETIWGYYVRIQTVNTHSGENRDIHRYNDVDYTTNGDFFRVFAKNAITGGAVLEFNASINGTDYQTENGLIITNIPITNSEPINLTVISENFIESSKTIIPTDEFEDFELFSSNTINFNFLDEETQQTVNNVSFEVYGETFYTSNDTTTGSFILEDLFPDTYNIRYGIDNDDYTTRNYQFKIPLSTFDEATFSLYLLNSTKATTFVRTVIDENNDPIDNGQLEVQRFVGNVSLGQGQWVTVERPGIAEGSGDAVFTAIANTQPYRFRILQDFELINTDSAIVTGSPLVDASQTFRINLADRILQRFDNCGAVTATIRNESGYFSLEFTNAFSVDQVCLDLDYTYRFNYTNYNNCSTSDSGSIIVSIDNTKTGTYSLIGYSELDGAKCTLDELEIKGGSFIFSSTDGGESQIGLFIIILIGLVLFSTMSLQEGGARYAIPIAIVFLISMTPRFIGFVAISNVMGMTILAFGLIVLFVGNRK